MYLMIACIYIKKYPFFAHKAPLVAQLEAISDLCCLNGADGP